MAPAERIAVGYVTRAKGVKGHVKVEALTHDSRRFARLAEIVLSKEGRADCRLRLESWRAEGRGLVVKFAGIDTCEQAREILVNGYITISPEEVLPLPQDAFYIGDLVGCRVETDSGEGLGEIVEVLQLPTIDAYVVRAADGRREFLVPAVGDFVVEVSIARRRVVVSGVEELLT